MTLQLQRWFSCVQLLTKCSAAAGEDSLEGFFSSLRLIFWLSGVSFFPHLKKKKLFKVTQPFLNRNTSRLKLISCINYLMEMIHMNSCSNHRVISGFDRMEIPRARHGQSLLPQISRISKEGNAEDTNIFMQWLNQAAQTRSPGMGLHLGDGFLEKNCWPTISKQQTESEGNLWFLYDSEMNSFIRLTTSESIRRVWHTRGTARAYSKAGHAGADSGEHPHSGRTFNFRFHSKQMLKPPLCLENFKLILKVKHVLWLLAESKTGR